MVTKTSVTSEAYSKFDILSTNNLEILRELAKRIHDSSQAAQSQHDVEEMVHEYELGVEMYVPILMAQSKIVWDTGNYEGVEKLLKRSQDVCGDHPTWKLNLAHSLYMQEGKYKSAIEFYEPLTEIHESILNVPAVILANLCVSYIMCSLNEEAEDLMRRIEKEEEISQSEDSSHRFYHFCIVNLVIGTLYCSKGNYEFGISRVLKSLEPFQKKLGTDTWYYTKKCLVSLHETLAKHLIVVKDSVFEEIFTFLDMCELHGRNISGILFA